VAKKPVAVTIGGQRYVVRSDADATYVRTLAGYLDERIEEVKNASRVIPTQKLAILAALNVADELFKERQSREDLKSKVREKSKAVLAFLDKEERKHFLDQN